MVAPKAHRYLAALVMCTVLLVQPRPIVADGDLFSKAVDMFSNYFSQDPNVSENYSAAKNNAENMQHARSRGMQYGMGTWKATAVEYYEQGVIQAQKYLGRAPIPFVMTWAKKLLPPHIANFLSSVLSMAGDSVTAASGAATRAAASVGSTASEAVKGSPGESFGDIHAKAQEGADALAQAAKAAGQKLHEAAKEARSEL